MRRVLRRVGKSAAKAQFKRLPQGWAFRAPTPWGIGARTHFLLTEEQKTQVEELLGVNYLLVSVVMSGWALFSKQPTPVLVVGVMAIMLLLNLCNWAVLRAPLKDVRQTTERITFADRLRTQGGEYTAGGLVAALVGCLFMFYTVLYLAIITGDWNASVGMTVLAASIPCACFIYFGSILVAKLTVRPASKTPS